MGTGGSEAVEMGELYVDVLFFSSCAPLFRRTLQVVRTSAGFNNLRGYCVFYIGEGGKVTVNHIFDLFPAPNSGACSIRLSLLRSCGGR